MGEGLKKTGKIALYIITPTVILLIVLFCIWAYKKYKKKNTNASSVCDVKLIEPESKKDTVNTENKNNIPKEVKLTRNLGVIKENKEKEKVEEKPDESKVVDEVKNEVINQNQ